MEPVVAGDPRERKPQPPWLVPVLAGGLVVTLVVLLVVVLANRGDGDEAPIATDAVTTEAPAATAEPVATETPTTTEAPATTEAPTTTGAPATTEAPTTTAAPVTTAVPETTAAPATGGALDVDKVSIDGTVFDVVNACGVTALVGFNVDSYVLDGGTERGAMLLEFMVDEGSDEFVRLSELRGEIEGFNGQDFSAGSYWGAVRPGGETTLVLDAESGNADGPVTVEFNLGEASRTCATGVRGNEWPFAPGEQPLLLDQFDERLGGGASFAVLGVCGTADGLLLLSEGGLLSSFELDGDVLVDAQFNPLSEPPTYVTNYFRDDPPVAVVDQQGGGGDVITIAKVFEFDGPDEYLAFTQPPVGVTGGLPLIEFC